MKYKVLHILRSNIGMLNLWNDNLKFLKRSLFTHLAKFVNRECKGSIWQFLTFYLLLIFISHFSTDEHFKLTKGSKLFLPFENSLLFYEFHNFKIPI